MPTRGREKSVVIFLTLIALAVPGISHAASTPTGAHLPVLARVLSPAVTDPQVLRLPAAAWPVGGPSLVDRAITAADADVESAFRVGTVFHRRTYAAGGMRGGFYQVDTGAGNIVWLGSLYGTSSQASAMQDDVAASLRRGGAAVTETSPCLPEAPACSRFSFVGASSTGTQRIIYAVWHEGNVLGELMVESPAAAPDDPAAFDAKLRVALDTVHAALIPPPTATPAATATPSPTATPTPRLPTATPTATALPPSVSVAAVAILHTAGGRLRATGTLRVGETGRFLVAYRADSPGAAGIAATVQLARAGGSFGLPLPLPTAVDYRGNTALEGRIHTTGMRAGRWHARFRVTAGSATATRDLSFSLAAKP